MDTRPSGRHRRAAAVPDAQRTLPAVSGRLRQPAVRRTPWSGQPPASRFRYRRGHCRRRASTAVAGGACMDGRPPPTAMSLLCSGGLRPVSAAESSRPASNRPHSRTSGGHCRGVRFRGHPWVPGQVGAAGRHRRSAARTADAACGHPQPAGGRHCGHPRPRHGHADTAAAACWTAGNGTVHCRLDVRPGTGPQGAASASTAMARPPHPLAPGHRNPPTHCRISSSLIRSWSGDLGWIRLCETLDDQPSR